MAADRRPVRINSHRVARSLLGALAVAPAFLLCSWLYYQSTDFVFGPLSYPQNAPLVKAIRWSIFGGFTLVLDAVIFFLKLWRSHYGNKPFSLLIRQSGAIFLTVATVTPERHISRAQGSSSLSWRLNRTSCKVKQCGARESDFACTCCLASGRLMPWCTCWSFYSFKGS